MSQGELEVAHGPGLRGPETRGVELGKGLHAHAQRRGAFAARVRETPDHGQEDGLGLEPARERLGLVEVEDAAAARLRVEAVREARLHAGGLVEEGERPDRGRQVLGEARSVALGLRLAPVRVVPSFLASTTPTACRST